MIIAEPTSHPLSSPPRPLTPPQMVLRWSVRLWLGAKASMDWIRSRGISPSEVSMPWMNYISVGMKGDFERSASKEYKVGVPNVES
jgi:hypothetical protein